MIFSIPSLKWTVNYSIHWTCNGIHVWYTAGGPTDEAHQSLNLSIQYWTSRGWAFVDVNYGGSTGLSLPSITLVIIFFNFISQWIGKLLSVNSLNAKSKLCSPSWIFCLFCFMCMLGRHCYYLDLLDQLVLTLYLIIYHF